MADTILTEADEFNFIDDGPVGPAALPDLVLASPVTQQPVLRTDTATGGATAANAPAASGGSAISGNAAFNAAMFVVGIFQQEQAAGNQALSLKAAAKNLYTEAAQTMRQGEYVAMTRGLDLEQRLGSLKTAVAASGVDSSSGSIQAATHMTETFGRLDVQMERLNAARRAKGLRAQAAQLEKQAEDVKDSTTLGAVGSIFEGAGDMIGGIF